MMNVAYEWKMKPSQLGICDPEDDMALMSAYLDAKSTMGAYELKISKQESDAHAASAEAAARVKYG